MILADQPDNSVTIVAVGWLTNIADLLDSPPDKYSPLNGKELVAAKVKELVSMGGVWPNTENQSDYNFKMDRPAANKVIEKWPGEIMFTSLGEDVMNGSRLASEVDTSNPVSAFYINFFKEIKVTERPSWDLIAVLYSVRGLSDYFTAVFDGHCIANQDGDNKWVPGRHKNHSYLVYKMPQVRLADVIENLLLTPPAALK